MEAIKQRLLNGTVEHQIAVLYEALEYGDAGLDLVVQVFKDVVALHQRGNLNQLMWTAYTLLSSRTEPFLKEVLWDYSPYQLFECLDTLTVYDPSHWSLLNVAISPDRQYLIASWDNTIKVLELKTGQEICTLCEHRKGIDSVAYSADGHILVSRSRYGGGDEYDRQCEIKVWELPAGREIHHFCGYGDFALSTDGRLLVIGKDSETLQVWDILTGQEICTFPGECCLESLAISADTHFLASHETCANTSKIRFWDLWIGQEISSLSRKALWYSDLQSFELKINDLTLNPDEPVIINGNLNNILKVWGKQTGKLICMSDWRFKLERIYHFLEPRSIAFSPEVKTFVCNPPHSLSDAICVWDLRTGQQITTFMKHKNLASIAFSQDGQIIVSGSYKGTIKIWGVP